MEMNNQIKDNLINIINDNDISKKIINLNSSSPNHLLRLNTNISTSSNVSTNTLQFKDLYDLELKKQIDKRMFEGIQQLISMHSPYELSSICGQLGLLSQLKGYQSTNLLISYINDNHHFDEVYIHQKKTKQVLTLQQKIKKILYCMWEAPLYLYLRAICGVTIGSIRKNPKDKIFEIWLDGNNIDTNSKDGYSGYIPHFIGRYLNTYNMQSIISKDIQSYLDKLILLQNNAKKSELEIISNHDYHKVLEYLQNVNKLHAYEHQVREYLIDQLENSRIQIATYEEMKQLHYEQMDECEKQSIAIVNKLNFELSKYETKLMIYGRKTLSNEFQLQSFYNVLENYSSNFASQYTNNSTTIIEDEDDREITSEIDSLQLKEDRHTILSRVSQSYGNDIRNPSITSTPQLPLSKIDENKKKQFNSSKKYLSQSNSSSRLAKSSQDLEELLRLPTFPNPPLLKPRELNNLQLIRISDLLSDSSQTLQLIDEKLYQYNIERNSYEESLQNYCYYLQNSIEQYRLTLQSLHSKFDETKSKYTNLKSQYQKLQSKHKKLQLEYESYKSSLSSKVFINNYLNGVTREKEYQMQVKAFERIALFGIEFANTSNTNTTQKLEKILRQICRSYLQIFHLHQNPNILCFEEGQLMKQEDYQSRKRQEFEKFQAKKLKKSKSRKVLSFKSKSKNSMSSKELPRPLSRQTNSRGSSRGMNESNEKKTLKSTDSSKSKLLLRQMTNLEQIDENSTDNDFQLPKIQKI